MTPESVREAIATGLANASGQDLRIAIPVTPLVPKITTDTAQAAATTARAISGTALRFTDGHDRFTLSPAQLAALVTIGTDASGSYKAQINSAAVRGAVLTLAKRVDRKAVDASYTWGATYAVVPSLTQSSPPCTPSLALNTALPLPRAVKLLG